MVEDKDQITLDESSLQETTQVAVKIQYHAPILDPGRGEPYSLKCIINLWIT